MHQQVLDTIGDEFDVKSLVLAIESHLRSRRPLIQQNEPLVLAMSRFFLRYYIIQSGPNHHSRCRGLHPRARKRQTKLSFAR